MTAPRLVLATHNAGKLEELRALLVDAPFVSVSAAELGLVAPDEDAPDFESRAVDKARRAAMATGLHAVADDTGLCVDELGGAPGLDSGPWAEARGGWGPARLALAEALGLTEDPRRRARAEFVCAIAWAEPDGRTWSATARVGGALRWPEQGEGPGFVRIFEPDEPPFWRDGVFEHRRRAFAAMMLRRAASLADG